LVFPISPVAAARTVRHRSRLSGADLIANTTGTFHGMIGNIVKQVNGNCITFTNGTGNASIHKFTNTVDEPYSAGSPPQESAISVVQNAIPRYRPAPRFRNHVAGLWSVGNDIQLFNNDPAHTLQLQALSPANGATSAQVNGFVRGQNVVNDGSGSDVNSIIGGGMNGSGGTPCP